MKRRRIAMETRGFRDSQQATLDMVKRSIDSSSLESFIVPDYLVNLRGSRTLVRESAYLARAIGAMRTIQRYLRDFVRHTLYQPGGLGYNLSRRRFQLMSGQVRATRRDTLNF